MSAKMQFIKWFPHFQGRYTNFHVRHFNYVAKSIQ